MRAECAVSRAYKYGRLLALEGQRWSAFEIDLFLDTLHENFEHRAPLRKDRIPDSRTDPSIKLF